MDASGAGAAGREHDARADRRRGLAIAYGGLQLLVAVEPGNLPRLSEISIDPATVILRKVTGQAVTDVSAAAMRQLDHDDDIESPQSNGPAP